MGTGNCFSHVHTCNKLGIWNEAILRESASTINLSPSYCGSRIQGRADLRGSFIRTLPLSAFIFSQGDLIQSQDTLHQPLISIFSFLLSHSSSIISSASLSFPCGYLIDIHPNLCKHLRSFYSTCSPASWLTRTPFSQLLRPSLAASL